MILIFLLVVALINTGSRTGAIVIGVIFLYYIYSQVKVSFKNIFGLAIFLFIISLSNLSGLIHIENIIRISESKEQIEDGNKKVKLSTKQIRVFKLIKDRLMPLTSKHDSINIVIEQ